MSVCRKDNLEFTHSQEMGRSQNQIFGAYYQNVKKTNRIARSLTITYIYMYITSLVAVKFSFVLGDFLSGFPTKCSMLLITLFIVAKNLTQFT